jgi:hypothetical protein
MLSLTLSEKIHITSRTSKRENNTSKSLQLALRTLRLNIENNQVKLLLHRAVSVTYQKFPYLTI